MVGFKEILIVLLLAHVLGDFYFQTSLMAKKKEKEIKWVCYHSIIYGVVSIILVKMCFPSFNLGLILIMIAAHAVIDILKYFLLIKQLKNKYKKYLFSVDQLLHITILIFISYFALNNEEIFIYNQVINNFLSIIGMPINITLSIILKIFLIHKPTNIFIVSIMNSYKPETKEDNEIKAGRMIGTIERIIMLFFLSIKQYSSVGLVLTAKSIARYNKIAEDQTFAEYYLMGTLLSTICVLLVSLV